ncbi:MAG: hypothetical protein AB7V16_09530 [Vulcanibacillus sp.]
MNKEEIIEKLMEKQLDDVVKMINDADKGFLGDLELVEQIGLINDDILNKEVINLLRSYNVNIIYVTDDEN